MRKRRSRRKIEWKGGKMVITEQSEVEEVRDCGRECNDMGGSGRQKKIVQEAEKDEES